MPKSRPKTKAAKPATTQPIEESVVISTPTKIAQLVALLRRANGARIDELMSATGWQAHSVRGAISGALKKKLKLEILSTKSGEGRVYRIAEEAQA